MTFFADFFVFIQFSFIFKAKGEEARKSELLLLVVLLYKFRVYSLEGVIKIVRLDSDYDRKFA